MSELEKEEKAVKAVRDMFAMRGELIQWTNKECLEYLESMAAQLNSLGQTTNESTTAAGAREAQEYFKARFRGKR